MTEKKKSISMIEIFSLVILAVICSTISVWAFMTHEEIDREYNKFCQSRMYDGARDYLMTNTLYVDSHRYIVCYHEGNVHNNFKDYERYVEIPNERYWWRKQYCREDA